MSRIMHGLAVCKPPGGLNAPTSQSQPDRSPDPSRSLTCVKDDTLLSFRAPLVSIPTVNVCPEKADMTIRRRLEAIRRDLGPYHATT